MRDNDVLLATKVGGALAMLNLRYAPLASSHLKRINIMAAPLLYSTQQCSKH